jgi:ketosteroid isomerase-like protein
MTRDPRIDIVEQLFAAWSSGDVDAPQHFFHEDATLYDIVGGSYTGWPAIRAFFDQGLKKWNDLVLLPDGYWTNDNGVAVRWVMSATVTDPSMFGSEHVGSKWSSEGLSYIDFRDGKITKEVDYHDRAAAARSLGIEVKR